MKSEKNKKIKNALFLSLFVALRHGLYLKFHIFAW